MITPTISSVVFGAWFEASTEAAFAVDKTSGVVVCANPHFAGLLARDVGAVVGADLRTLLSHPEPWPGRLTSAGHHDHVGFRDHHGGEVHLTLAAIQVAAPGHGELVAYLGRDTSAHFARERERLAAHEELAHLVSELSDAKLQLEDRNHEISVLAGQVSRFGWRATVGELVAGIAHHLNNPVGALSSTLRRLETKVVEVPDPNLRAGLQQLVQRGREIGTRIERNVSAVVRAHEVGAADSTSRWLRLHQEIEAALSMFADRLQQVMVIRNYQDDVPVCVPHDSLHLVMSNLIDNSLHALGKSGILMIAVRSNRDHFTIRISDSGSGVAANVVPHLFDPILSARRGGAGLGLSTARRLARAWGGDVVYVPSSNGCTFEILIPVRAGDAASPSPPRRADLASVGAIAEVSMMRPRDRQRARSASRPQEPNEDPS